MDGSNTNSPFPDHAKFVLESAAGIDDSQRADLWDVFHDSKDPAELAERLKPFVVPDQVQADLIDAKKRQLQPDLGSVVEKGFKVIERLGGLDVAEKHPNVSKAMLRMLAGSSLSEE